MKSKSELKVLLICYISLMSLILIILLSILFISTYSLVITGDIPVQEYCCLLLLVIIIMLLLKLYACSIIMKIDINNEIIYYSLLGKIVSDKKEIIPIINNSKILLYKALNKITKRKKLIIVLKDYYRKEDLISFCRII